MTQIFLPLLIGLVAAFIVWRLIGRLIKSPARRALQVTGAVGVLALVAALSPRQLAVPVRAQSQRNAPAETMVVEPGSLTITQNATGSLSPAERIELAFEQSAPVAEVLVTEGQSVKAGDVLARLDSTNAEAAVRNAEIALAQAQANYDNLIQPPRPVDVAVAEAQVKQAEAALYSASLTAPDTNDEEIARLQAELAKNQLWQMQINRDMALAPNPEFRNGNGGASAQEINMNSQVAGLEYNAEIQDTNYGGVLSEGPNAGSLASANASVVQAQVNLENLVNPASAAELRRAEIDLETARLDLQQAQQQLTQTQLTAPIDGLIADEDLTVGEMPPSRGAITLIDDTVYRIDLAIDETDIVNVEVGQPIVLNLDALPEAEITGTVTKVASAPTIQEQLVTYVATVTLDEPPAAVRPGMNATATIIISELDNVLVVPNRFIRVDTETQRTFITVEDDGQYRDVPVVIGARNDAESQIVSGLEAGQTIALLSSVAGSPNTTAFGARPGAGFRGN